jgi:sporulation protein YlmC with PRC-barrel domain
MKFTDLVGRPVMELATATSIGLIDDGVMDPSTGRLAGFVLKKTPGKADWLAWDQINALGADALTVAGADTLTVRADSAGLLLRGSKVIGGRVLTNQGWELANLAEIDLDPATGQVTGLLLADGTALPPGDLIGIGRYATIVQHQS